MVRMPVARIRRVRVGAAAVSRKPARKVARRPAAKKSPARRPPAKKTAKGGPVPGTPSPTRTRMTPELQAHVKRLYETTDQPICQIGLDVGINESVIRRMGPREGWVRFVPPPQGLPPLATLLAEVEELEASLSLPRHQRGYARLRRDGGGEGRFGERERDETGWGNLLHRRKHALNRKRCCPTPNPSPPFEERTGEGKGRRRFWQRRPHRALHPHRHGAYRRVRGGAPRRQAAAQTSSADSARAEHSHRSLQPLAAPARFIEWTEP